MTRVLLIRHAQATGNIDGVFQGHLDSGITEVGMRQLDSLAERMKGEAFDAVYSSPLIRAKETANAANRHHKLPITFLEELMEINGGDWEALPFDEIPNLYPEHSAVWENEPYNFVAPNGEAMRNVCKRMVETIGRIAEENNGRTVCVVSHGCAIRNYVTFLRYGTLEKLAYVEWCDNTAIYTIEYENGVAKLIGGADSSHLDKRISTFHNQSWWKNIKTDD
ncbi:MAG: histidine phosphatase family protein [Clostridia bacterium]|nr:histidine phosphatase family protein [Clostridia bacterium]